MKFVHITDIHLSASKPGGWKVDYYRHVLANLEFVLEKASSIGAKALIVSGDFFDRDVQSIPSMIGITALLNKYKHVPVITCLGQHDVFGHNSAEYANRSIAILESAGLLTILNNGDHRLFGDVKIAGYSFNDPETDMLLKGQDEVTDPYFTIALVHASVGSEDSMGRWACIKNQNIRSVDLALFGDIHPGFESHEFDNGVVAIGIGSFGRRSRSDYGRPTQYAIIDVDDKELSYEIEIFKVPEIDDDEIFDMDYSSGNTVDVAEMKLRVDDLDKIKDETVVDRVRRIGKAFDHTDESIGLLLSKCGEEV